MNCNGTTLEICDNGGRRSDIDRRYYSYSGHIPERRSGVDRRKLEDRRQEPKVVEFGQKQQGVERRGGGF